MHVDILLINQIIELYCFRNNYTDSSDLYLEVKTGISRQILVSDNLCGSVKRDTHLSNVLSHGMKHGCVR